MLLLYYIVTIIDAYFRCREKTISITSFQSDYRPLTRCKFSDGGDRVEALGRRVPGRNSTVVPRAWNDQHVVASYNILDYCSRDFTVIF